MNYTAKKISGIDCYIMYFQVQWPIYSEEEAVLMNFAK